MSKELLIQGEAMNASTEGMLAVEQFLNDNYLFRRNVLNGKVEFSTKPPEGVKPMFRPLTQQALNSIVLKAKREEIGEKPKGIVRYVPATMSITKLLQRMDAAQGLHLFALSEEIDTVHKAFSRGFSNFSEALRVAFDNGLYGQDYASENSWSGNVALYYNCLAAMWPDCCEPRRLPAPRSSRSRTARLNPEPSAPCRWSAARRSRASESTRPSEGRRKYACPSRDERPTRPRSW